jgi:hypothetical protein
MKLLLRLLVCISVFAVPALAETLIFTANLSGDKENPPNASPGTGTALVTYDSVAHILEVHAEFQDLWGTTTVAHIHCCVDAPGNVGVATYPGTFPGFPVGVTSGVYDTPVPIDLTSTSSYTAGFLNTFGGGTAAGAEAALVAGMQAGRAYFNIHTTFAPGGEIRGFLEQQVPEPGTALLLAVGLVLLFGSRSRLVKTRTS